MSSRIRSMDSPVHAHKPLLRSSRLAGVDYDIRGPVLATARQMEEEGISIIKLNIGNVAAFGLLPPDAMARDMAMHLGTARAAGYSDSKGLIEVRELVAGYARGKGVAGVTPDDVYLGNGASELIGLSISAMLSDGDEVLIPSPDYPLYTAVVSLAGGRPVHYRCDEGSGWMPDIDHLRSRITPRTKALVIINPNNPTGALYPPPVLRQLVDVARQHGLVVLADEIYDNTIYDGAKHTSTASLATDVLFITFNGLSKNFRACGYRAGWMVVSGPREQAADYLAGINTLASLRLCANTLGQLAIGAALRKGDEACGLVSPGGRLGMQRDLAHRLLSEIPGVSAVRPAAAMYVFPRLDPALYPIADDRQFALDLLVRERVLIVQGSGFNLPSTQHFRIAFLPEAAELEEAIRRIARFLAGFRRERRSGLC